MPAPVIEVLGHLLPVTFRRPALGGEASGVICKGPGRHQVGTRSAPSGNSRKSLSAQPMTQRWQQEGIAPRSGPDPTQCGRRDGLAHSSADGDSFDTTKQTISLQVRNILPDWEVRTSVVKESLTTAEDGKMSIVLDIMTIPVVISRHSRVMRTQGGISSARGAGSVAASEGE